MTFALLITCKAAWYIISVVCRVCPSVCQCMYACRPMYLYLSDDNFRRPWRRNFMHRQCISRKYGSSSYL